MSLDLLPIPDDASRQARILAQVARSIPAGEWATYGDLAEAYTAATGDSMVARAVGSSLGSIHAFGGTAEQWVVPWHRIRLENGHIKSRSEGEIVDPAHWINQLYAAEAGPSAMVGGAARSGRRTALAAMIRHRKIVINLA